MYGTELSQTARLSNSSGKARVAVLTMASPEGRWTGPQELSTTSAGVIGGLQPHQRTFAGPVEIIERDAEGRVLSREVSEVEVMNSQARALAAFRLESGKAASVEVRTLGQSKQYAGTVLRYQVMNADELTADAVALLRR